MSRQTVIFSENNEGMVFVPTLTENIVRVFLSGDITRITPSVGDTPADFLALDIPASNGFVSTIDTVLKPFFLDRELLSYAQRFFPTFSRLLVTAGLDDVITDGFGFTVSLSFFSS